VYAILFKTLPEKNAELVYFLIGNLFGGFFQVMNYYFGSSSGSKEKTQIFNALRKEH
jgi:hypothetical protein